MEIQTVPSQNQIQNLPTGGQVEKPNGTTSLEAEIEKSKKILQAESQKIEKSKGGRPKGSRDKAPRRRKNEPLTVSEFMPQGAAPGPQIEVETVSLKPFLETAVKIPFDIAANKTGFEGFKITQDEAGPTAEAFDQVLKLYLPDMAEKNPKELALVTAFASLMGLGLSKYYLFSEWKKATGKTEGETEPQKPTASTSAEHSKPPAGTIPAQNYFPQKAI